LYVVGETSDSQRLHFGHRDGNSAIDLAVADMLGNPPKTVIEDNTASSSYADAETDPARVPEYIENVLTLESVACKDWLTNKVDRSVTGRVARQQCVGELQLPLSDCGVVALDYQGRSGIATSIGHAPQVALANVTAGSRIAVAEALTNIVGAPLHGGLSAISLSANWMWPCKNPGEDAALYSAVEACSDFVTALGINIPTGKDSLSMTQKYADGTKVAAPGTVIISAAGEVDEVRATVSPVIKRTVNSTLYYIDFSSAPLALGGSALAQTLGKVGSQTPDVTDVAAFSNAFATVQRLVAKRYLAAIHDVSAGGLVTTLLEMCFSNVKIGLNFYTDGFVKYGETDIVKILFAENPAVVVQIEDTYKASAEKILDASGVKYFPIASPIHNKVLTISHSDREYLVSIPSMRKVWYETSYQFDRMQTSGGMAEVRRDNLGLQPVSYK
ncbi:MAG: phosphoribosylformylglycinamidine synthase, partial [Muribaculaceae bacterium]|nr:phosphoribosylformylglycinamidine synthase [Muribaculaceae bacterium]